MHLRPVRFLAVALLLGAARLAAADRPPPVTPNVVDETGTVKGNTQEVAELQANLVEFEDETHIRIFVQYHVKSPPDAEDAHPGDYMRALSSKLGLIKNGILMVHFGDDPDWRVWIGDDLTPRFVGKPGTARDFTESGAMHEAKEALLKSAMKAAADAYAGMHAPAPDFKDPHNLYAHIYLRLQTAALIDALKAKFAAPQ
jgi:hypothetical protein